MANKKGKGGEMAMGGTIRLSLLPEVLDKLRAEKEVNIELGLELSLQLKAGSKNEILEMSPWFDADKARVSIENSIASDGSLVCFDYIEVDVKSSENRSFGFTVLPEQAEALAQVLMNYAQASKAVEALRSEQPAV